MKKVLSIALVLSSFFFGFCSCSGYNKIMRDHLSTPENYQMYEVILVDMCYQDPSTYEILRDFEKSDFLNYDVTIYVTFRTLEDISNFLGSSPNPDIPLEEYELSLVIPTANSKILYENGFYEKVALGDEVRVMSSNWIYMDSNFFYIAQVEHNGEIYLTFDDGLKNITNMTNKNKSLF